MRIKDVLDLALLNLWPNDNIDAFPSACYSSLKITKLILNHCSTSAYLLSSWTGRTSVVPRLAVLPSTQ